jgi:nitrite reductase/ring-hydroxylating ferredoxin subunit
VLGEIVGRFVDRQHWLDRAGDVLEKVADAAFDHLGPLSKPFEDVLHGTQAGHPVHAALTDIPVGAWTTTLALDLAGIDEGADFALKVGLAGAAGAALAGLADWRYTEGSHRRTGVAHALLNIAGTTLYAVSAFQRGNGNRETGRVLSHVGFGFILGAGFLGGDLVYKMGLMVNRNAWVTGSSPFRGVIPLVDLEENRPTHVRSEDDDLVLVRVGDTVYAMAQSCAHLGAPLSEGKIIDGCLVCPWHKSRFRLEDGRAVRGPTAFHQPHYETRVRNGLVEVRLGGEYGQYQPWYRTVGVAGE